MITPEITQNQNIDPPAPDMRPVRKPWTWRAELAFVGQLISQNLSSAMEYRASFISQIIGMAINNGIMLVFWVLFFDRFGTVGSFGMPQILLLFSIVALSFGIAFMFAGNIGFFMAALIAQGRLDYYLVFPRNLLLHVIMSRMQISAVGDLVFGIVLAFVAVNGNIRAYLTALLVSLMSAIIFAAYGVVAGSLSFFIGNAQNASAQAVGATLTFSMYPPSLFSGLARVVLMTILPAAFIGSIPAQIVETGDWRLFGMLAGVCVIAWLIATAVFYTGLRRYESGNAINAMV